MESEKIKINICGRSYPINVRLSEKEKLQNSVKIIESIVNEVEKNYAVKDSMDSLAIASVRLAMMLENLKEKEDEIERELKEIRDMLRELVKS